MQVHLIYLFLKASRRILPEGPSFLERKPALKHFNRHYNEPFSINLISKGELLGN